MNSLIVRENLSFSESKILTTRNIATELMKIFKNHIGSQNYISRRQLFKKLFNKDEDENNAADYLRWEFVKKAMHYLRKYTKCFIVSERKTKNSPIFVFYVAETLYDAEVYTNKLESCIRAMRTMEKRCVKSVNEEWFKERWELPKREVKLLLRND